MGSMGGPMGPLGGASLALASPGWQDGASLGWACAPIGSFRTAELGA
jgi:hypothetical protein